MLWVSTTQAQESTNAGGGNATGNGGSASYSVGQVVYTTHFDSIGSISQGVQHAYEIFTTGGNETIWKISLSAFPNPTTDDLILAINDFIKEQLTYLLYDMEGKLLIRGLVIAPKTQVSTSGLSSATYIISIVNQENKIVQSFKVIKK